MASSISYEFTIKDGLAVNPPLIASGGKIGAFAVLAHQIDWRQTTFANNNIMDYDGDSTTEKLLNAIESYICNHNMTGDVTGDVTGNVTGDVTGNVTGDVTGDLTGNTYGNTYGTVFGDTVNAFLTTIKQDTDHNSTYYIALVNKTSGSSYTYVDSDGLYFNPNKNSLTVSGYLNVGSNETINGYLTVKGNTTLGNESSDTITVNGKTNFKQSVNIDSTLNVDSNITIGGNETLTGNLTVNGDTTLGDVESTGEITATKFNGELNGNASTATTANNSYYLQTQYQATSDFYGNQFKAFIKWKDSDTAQFAFTDGNYTFYADEAGSISWDGITNKPTTFTPGTHSHDVYYSSEVTRTKNTVLAAPNGSNGTATFRSLVANDIPNLAASKITSGTFDIARIPTGTGADKVALGNHTHNYITAGTQCIELNTVATLKNYGGFIDFHYRNNDGDWTNDIGQVYKDANGNKTYPDYTSRIIEDEPGQITINSVKFKNNEVTATKFVGALNGNASSASSVPWDGITGKPSTFTPSGHSHHFVPSGIVSVSLAQTATASGTPNSGNTTSVATGAHTHTTVNNGAHTHSVEGVTASTGSHTHTVTSNVTISGTESKGVLIISLTNNQVTSSSDGLHVHDVEGEAMSAGSHGHTINATAAGSRVNMPNTSHTHNYDKASVQSASFSGDQGTTV